MPPLAIKVSAVLPVLIRLRSARDLSREISIDYLPRVDEIIIVRSLRGSRDIASIAEDGEFII